jgi:tetratricopeptide (TPR) repeat protein
MTGDPAVHQALMAASQCLQRRDVAGAERALAPIAALSATVPAVQHMLGMVRLFQGQFESAAALFAKARGAVPQDPMLAYNEGQALAGLGRFADALVRFRAALALKPDFMEARFETGRLLHQTGAVEEAEQAFREILRVMPGQEHAQVALGAVLIDQGRPGDAEAVLRHALAGAAPDIQVQLNLHLSLALRRQRKDREALAACDAAQGLAPALPDIVLHRADSLQNLGRHEEALAIYEKLVTQDPANPAWHHSYNELLHRLGRKDAFLRSYERAPQSRPLLLGKAFFLAQQERHGECHAVYQTLLQRDPRDRLAAVGAARTLARLGRHAEADAGFVALMAAPGADPALFSVAAEVALLAGDAQKAARLCEQGLGLAPHHGACLAYLSLAWRMLDDERDEALGGYDSLIRYFDLEPPDGFTDMAGFNAELNAALDALHPDTRGFLGQSLRGGTQTSEHLFAIGHPLIRKLQIRIDQAVERYIAELREDSAHPFLSRRARGFRYTGSWSSRLADQGFHVNHIHPEGWISSCYYVALPEAVKDQESRQGWIKFGEPALDVPLRAPIRRAIQPVVGRLVLFPSYLWHGTIPFHDRACRTTIAFDVAPVA